MFIQCSQTRTSCKIIKIISYLLWWHRWAMGSSDKKWGYNCNNFTQINCMAAFTPKAMSQ